MGKIYDRANGYLSANNVTVESLFNKFNVEIICPSVSLIDDLQNFETNDRMDDELSKWNLIVEEKETSEIITVKLFKSDFFENKDVPFRFAVECKNGEKVSNWQKGDRYYGCLILGRFSPDLYVFVVPKEAANLKQTNNYVSGWI